MCLTVGRTLVWLLVPDPRGTPSSNCKTTCVVHVVEADFLIYIKWLNSINWAPPGDQWPHRVCGPSSNEMWSPSQPPIRLQVWRAHRRRCSTSAASATCTREEHILSQTFSGDNGGGHHLTVGTLTHFPLQPLCSIASVCIVPSFYPNINILLIFLNSKLS